MTTTVITMPQAIDSAIMEMLNNAQEECVKVLADKYNMDLDDAMRQIGDLKLVRKRGPAPKNSMTKSSSDDDTKTKAKAKPKEKIKRAKTGYLLFIANIRDKVTTELQAELDEDKKVMSKDVTRAAAARWQELDDDEKEEWKTKAKELAELESDEEPKTESKATDAKATKATKAKTKEIETKEIEEVLDAESESEDDELDAIEIDDGHMSVEEEVMAPPPAASKSKGKSGAKAKAKETKKAKKAKAKADVEESDEDIE